MVRNSPYIFGSLFSRFCYVVKKDIFLLAFVAYLNLSNELHSMVILKPLGLCQRFRSSNFQENLGGGGGGGGGTRDNPLTCGQELYKSLEKRFLSSSNKELINPI
jgi:hypothetical protein